MNKTNRDTTGCGFQPTVNLGKSSLTHDKAPRIQHVQPGAQAYQEATREALNYLNGAILQMSSIPSLYTTKQTAAELQKAADYVAQIKLEEELFSSASPEWQDRYSQRELVTQRQALLRLKDKLTDPGGQFLARYRTNMDFGKVRCTSDECATNEFTKQKEQDDGIGWTSTSVRAAHAWAMHELQGLNSELAPLAEEARKRMQQYMDEIDITDRYSGFRRSLGNMHRRDPNDLTALRTVMESNTRPLIAPRWNLSSNWLRAEAVGTQNHTVPGESPEYCPPKEPYLNWSKDQEDAQKEAGILYPGRSEYEDAYLIPTFVETGMHKTMPPTTHRATFEQPPGIRGRGSMVDIDPPQMQNKGYKVNPRPDYLKEFSKPKCPKPEDLLFPQSEMTTSYVWPDMPKPKQVPLAME